MNKYFFIFIFLGVTSLVKAQNSFKFYNYLIENNLTAEFEQVITKNESKLSIDSINYLKFKYNLQSQKVDALSFSSANQIIKKDTSLYIKYFTTLISLNDSLRNKYINETIRIESDTISRYVYRLNKSIDSSSKQITTTLPIELQNEHRTYCKIQNKKKRTVVLLSLIPGIGKKYIGRNKSGNFMFLTQSVFALKMIESIKVLGYSNPYTILTYGVFSLYYLSGIVGTYEDVRIVKQEAKLKYIEAVKNHINNIF